MRRCIFATCRTRGQNAVASRELRITMQLAQSRCAQTWVLRDNVNFPRERVSCKLQSRLAKLRLAVLTLHCTRRDKNGLRSQPDYRRVDRGCRYSPGSELRRIWSMKVPGRSAIPFSNGAMNLGGTWDLFRYPGIRTDSDMHTFGYRVRAVEACANRIADASQDIKDYLNRRHRQARDPPATSNIGQHVVSADFRPRRCTLARRGRGRRRCSTRAPDCQLGCSSARVITTTTMTLTMPASISADFEGEVSSPAILA